MTPLSNKIWMNGHFKDELWGLAIHPEKEEFITVGEDGVLAKWSATNTTQIAKRKLDFSARCCCINPKG